MPHDPAPDWYADQDLWELLEPALFPPESWDEARETVHRLVTRLGLAHGATVLDLGSGPGRHALPLAERGFRVTAVDTHRGYLRRLAEAAQDLPVERVEDDIRRFRRPGAFDLAISMFNTLGYFERPEDDLDILRNARASLRPSGVLAIDVAGKEVSARTLVPRYWHALPEGGYVLEETRVEADWAALRVTWTVLRPGGAPRNFPVRLRLWSGVEFGDLLRAAGFSDIVLLGDGDGRPYDERAARLFALARA